MRQLKRRKIGTKSIVAVLAAMMCVMVFAGVLIPQKVCAKQKTETVLFIGNSFTYYNNLPEMYERLASAGTGHKVKQTSIPVASRALDGHAKAIKAVIRSKGNSGKLSKNEKKYFCYYTNWSQQIGGYNQHSFDRYKNAIMDQNGKIRHYDYIVVQEFPRNLTYDKCKDGLYTIVNLLADKNTTVVVTVPNQEIYTDKSFVSQKKEQDKIDKIVAKAQKYVKGKKLKCKDIKVAYLARADFNYFFTYGKTPAVKKAGSNYKVYKKSDVLGPGNDLLIYQEGRYMHPSQLGTYMMAASVYSAIYGKSAKNTVTAYKANVTKNVDVLNKTAGDSNFALKNGNFKGNRHLRNVCYIAYQTQVKGMNLSKPK